MHDITNSLKLEEIGGPAAGPGGAAAAAVALDAVPAGDQLAAFAGVLFASTDIIEFRLIDSGRQTESQWFEANAIATALPWLTMRNAAGWNVYLGLNPRSAKGARGDEAVPLARTVFVDIDDSALVHADILSRVQSAGLPLPTMVVFSGHGWWIFWKLAEPITDMALWRRMQASLIARLGSDATIKNPERIGRVPGFINWKPPAAKSYLAEIDVTRVYDQAMFAPEPVKAAPAKPSRPAGRASELMRYSAYVDAMPDAVSGGGAGEKLMFQVLAEAHRFGLSEADAWPIILTYNNTRCFRNTGESWPWPEDDLRRQFGRAKLEVEKGGEYGNKLQEPPPARTASAIAPQGVPAATDHPDPPIIPIDALDLPDLPFEVLPVWASDFACSLSAAKETPLAMAILLQLAVLASTVQRVYRVRVEPAYHECLCIYACPAMESGERKTAIYQPIMRPLFELQKALRGEASAEIDRVKITRGLAEAELKSLRRKFFAEKDSTARDSLQKEIESKTAALPLVPAMPQLVSEDSTEAALGITMANNQESQLVGSDEGGFFDNLASVRFNDVSELDLFLKSHTGSPHTVNRVGRENIYLHRPLLSIAISPQPHVLAALGDKAGFLNRGGLARFLTALPESAVGRRKLLPATVPEDVRRGWSDAVGNLARIGRAFTEEQPSDILLHGDAYREWKTFERLMEPRMGENGDLHGIKPWASKLPGAVARIAAVCHAAEWGQDAGRYELPAARMSAAIRLGEALIPHALAVHRLMGGGGFNTAESVVEFYNRSGWPGESLPLTGWWRPCRSVVGETSKLFEPVADRLVDHGFLIPADPPHRPGKRGRWFRANRQLVRKSENPCTTKQG